MAAFTAWLLQEGAGLFLGVALRALLEYLNDRRAAVSQKQTGRLEAERDQALEGERVQGELAAEAAVPIDEDEALKRLKDGTA